MIVVMRKIYVICFALLYCNFSSAQDIVYMQPDIGAPGMNMYVEIFANVNQLNNFGEDGFYLNNPGDLVRIKHVNPADSSKIIFGPLIVSWNGRLISSTFFIDSKLQPNSSYQDDLNSEFIIPFQVLVNGNPGNVEKFYVVKPIPALVTNIPGILGSEGIWGKRSKRGAMIFENIDLSANHVYTLSSDDTDDEKPGNQGFLPALIFSKQHVIFRNGAQLSAGGIAQNAGVGGGGGGGAFFQQVGEPVPGGDGFTGGQMRNNPGNGSGSVGFGSNGGMSLSGVDGGNGGASGTAGTGGGTGFAFGSSGQGALPSQCNTNNLPQMAGGGSGANKCGNLGYGGAGGGFGTDGTSYTSGNGKRHANAMLVPITGGSGGAGGNAVNGQAGYGGGGGGALHLSAEKSIQMNSILLRGADGGSTGLQQEGSFSGAGGGGTGGGLVLSSKTFSRINQLQMHGGNGGLAVPFQNITQNGGNGGAGRLRINGNDSLNNNTIHPSNASQYIGHSIDTATVAISRNFSVKGFGNGNPVDVYVKPQSGQWTLAATASNYNKRFAVDVQLRCEDSIFYISTAQRVTEIAQNNFEHHPVAVFSQSGSNNVFSPAPPTMVPISSNAPLCKDLDLKLAAVFESPFYQWKGPDGFESNERFPQIENMNGNKEGRYYLDALVYGCDVETGYIDVEVKLPPVISLGKDTVVCKNIGFTISPGLDFAEYLWHDGSTAKVFAVKDSGNYQVQIIDIYGCEASAKIKVEEFCENNVWLPNTFSPNGDGINDFFGPTGNISYDISMRIFNRWGTMIFNEKGYYPRWDGTYKGSPCPQDIYIVELEYYYEEINKRYYRNGTVMLLR
jgi:gliding motility-associated-like protein